jgi:hypothetical protein
MAMPTRAEALEILRNSRVRTEALIAGVDEAQMKTLAALGGGNWSVKDLIGHLAGWEELALVHITGQRPRHLPRAFTSADEFNAAEIERKRDWSLAKVRKDAERVRTALLAAIESMDDEHWMSKVEAGKGRSTLALVLGRTLAGGRHGLFAHDLAHLRDLDRSVRSLGRR